MNDQHAAAAETDEGHPRVLRDLLLRLLPDGRPVATADYYRCNVVMAYKDRTVSVSFWHPDPRSTEPQLPDLHEACRAWFASTNAPKITNPRTIDGLGCEFSFDDEPVAAPRKRAAPPAGKPKKPALEEPVAEDVEPAGTLTPHACMFCTGCELWQCDSYHGEDGSWPCDYCDAVWNHFANCV